MIYVLIIIYISSHSATSTSVEFNTVEACRSAAVEIQKQLQFKPDAILCAQKGLK